eukprot:11171987-Lingulodinium_polyedra.AAC.1
MLMRTPGCRHVGSNAPEKKTRAMALAFAIGRARMLQDEPAHRRPFKHVNPYARTHSCVRINMRTRQRAYAST